MRILRTILLASVALPGAAGLAAAQVPPGFYVAAGIGANWLSNATVQTRGDVAAALGGENGRVRFSVLPMGTLALGYGFGNGIRVELEGSLRANGVESARGFTALQPLQRAQGELWNYGVMANALVDLDFGQPEWVRPYLGLGLGYVQTELQNFRVNGNGARLTVDSSDGSLAYQAIAGAAFPIGAVPGLSATAEYVS